MSKVVYAVRVNRLSTSGLNVPDVKIGKTTNIKSTLSQYRRSHRGIEILDLWKPNENLNLSSCERSVQDIAEKYACRRDSEKFIFLQDSYDDFSESVSKLLKTTTKDQASKEKKEQEEKKYGGKEDFMDRDYTGRKPKLIVFDENYFEPENWRDIIRIVSKKIYEKVDDFSEVLDIKGRKRVYFSENEEDLIHPVSISETPYLFEGNISANQAISIVDKLLDQFDIEKSKFKLFLKRED